MSVKAAMTALERRCFRARITLSSLCDTAGVSASAITRYRAGENLRVSTIARLEDAMSRIEADRT